MTEENKRATNPAWSEALQELTNNILAGKYSSYDKAYKHVESLTPCLSSTDAQLLKECLDTQYTSKERVVAQNIKHGKYKNRGSALASIRHHRQYMGEPAVLRLSKMVNAKYPRGVSDPEKAAVSAALADIPLGTQMNLAIPAFSTGSGPLPLPWDTQPVNYKKEPKKEEIRTATPRLDLSWYRKVLRSREVYTFNQFYGMGWGTVDAIQMEFLSAAQLVNRESQAPSTEEANLLKEARFLSLHLELPIPLEEQRSAYISSYQAFPHRLIALLWVVVRKHYAENNLT